MGHRWAIGCARKETKVLVLTDLILHVDDYAASNRYLHFLEVKVFGRLCNPCTLPSNPGITYQSSVRSSVAGSGDFRMGSSSVVSRQG